MTRLETLLRNAATTTVDDGIPVARCCISRALLIEAADDLARKDAALSGAIGDVAAERRRQIDVEGWTPEHDIEHTGGEMAAAAACYALAGSLPLEQRVDVGASLRGMHPLGRDTPTVAALIQALWPR